MSKFLKSDKAPYLLTLMVAALGWSFERLVERETASPVLEYSIEDKPGQAGGGRDYTVSLTNLSRAIAFKDISFVLDVSADKVAKITHAETHYVAPAHANPDGKRMAVIEGAKNATYFYPEIHPGASVRLYAVIDGKGAPSLCFDSQEQAVRLLKGGFHTWLLRHEMSILLSGMLLWSVVIGIYFFALP